MSEIRNSAGCLVFHPSDPRFVLIVESKHHGGWSLPFGKVEEGESLADGALRETFEETGLLPTLVLPSPIFVQMGKRFLSHCFLGQVTEDQATHIRSSSEGVAGWHPISKLYEDGAGDYAQWNINCLRSAARVQYVLSGKRPDWMPLPTQEDKLDLSKTYQAEKGRAQA